MNRRVLSIFVLLGLSVSVAPATVLRVPAEYSSIQQAISAAGNGDTVLVTPGIYYETINFSGKNIVVTSTDPNDRKIVGYTIIHADQDGTAVTFENGESAQAVLTGFTITGGVGTLESWSSDSYRYFRGGGIYCRYASPTIIRNVITNNHLPYSREDVDGIRRYTESYGGGIGCDGGRPTITHNIIRNNSAGSGGGVYVDQGIVANNIIYSNAAETGGGVSLCTSGR